MTLEKIGFLTDYLFSWDIPLLAQHHRLSFNIAELLHPRIPLMSRPVCEWNLDDCRLFLQKIAKTLKALISASDNIVEDIVPSFRKNHIIGASLIAFRDKEREQLIPFLGFHFHCRKGISKLNEKDEDNTAKRYSRKNYERNSANHRNAENFVIFFKGKVLWCGHKQLGRPHCRLGELNVSETVLDLPEDIFLLLLPKEGSEPAVENIVTEQQKCAEAI